MTRALLHRSTHRVVYNAVEIAMQSRALSHGDICEGMHQQLTARAAELVARRKTCAAVEIAMELLRGLNMDAGKTPRHRSI
jgi:hypothetical protein